MIIQELKRIRKEKGVLAKDLAKTLNITPSEICNYEKGKIQPRANLIGRWVEALDHELQIVRK
jgi:transcriptional regulator with XRE-family HTH domain